ncbi:MAG TPA: ParB/RepB/Spo0J family partition protein [Phycisphaerales bacterium]|nr:ParB/RepB/Spo0J family partition protein [Phycisphaerales bacterium]
MAKEKKRHLGKGLEALLGPTKGMGKTDQSLSDISGMGRFPKDEALRNSIRMVSVTDLKPNPYQPRTSWDQDQLHDLADSVRSNGIIQPILVRRADTGFEIIAGERRFRAAEMVGLSDVPAIVRDATDEQMLELAIIENIHRSDLNPIERAVAYQEFINTFSLTQAEAAQRLGEGRSVVANYLRLLDLPQEIKQMLIDKTLSMGHARAILALPTDDLRRKLANRAMAGRLNVRDVEQLVRTYLHGREAKAEPKQKPANILDLEQRLRETLGTKVQINTGKNTHRGRIIIDYYSLDEFERLTEKMGLSPAEEI